MRSMTRLAVLVAACVLSCAPAAAQTLVKDSALPLASTLTGSEGMKSTQGTGCATSVSPCANVRVTPAQIATYLAPIFQASDADLTAIAALSTTPFGRSLLTMADAPSTRAAIGVSATGADATYLYRSNNLSDLGSVSAARSNLGLVIGTTIETWSANLDALAALSGTNTIYYRSGSNTWSPVVLGPNFAFSGGNLTIPGLPITASGDATGSTSASSGALALTLATVNTTPGSYGGALTIPTLTTNGKGLVTASGSIALGTVPITQGGTGSTTASAARSALGSAASGTNNDITAINGLTTALSVAQGGTGGTTAAAARSGIGAAASGANTDISSINGSAATLTTARKINGVSFNGGADITINAVDSTPRAALAGAPFTGNVSTTGGFSATGNAYTGTQVSGGVTAEVGVISSGAYVQSITRTAGVLQPLFLSATSVLPLNDNGTVLGSSSARYSNVFAVLGTYTGALTATTIQATAASTVANLPTCNAAARGTHSVVTDATAPTFLGSLSGGGSVVAPAFCNGSAWVAG